MSWHMDNYEGEHIDVELASVEELQRIRAEIVREIDQGSLVPARILRENIDVIDEELEGRS